MEVFTVKMEYEKNTLGWDFTLALPKEISDKYKNTDKRLLCTINNKVKWHCAMMPDGNGNYFIIVSKKNRKQVSDQVVDDLEITIEKDESKYGTYTPSIFEEICEQDPQGSKLFHELTIGKQRSLIHLIGKLKSEEKQLEKNLIIFDYLKKVNGKLDFKELNEEFKNNRFRR